MASFFSTGIGALGAAQAGLTTTGHNIANVNTPGFSRQATVQATNPPQFNGGGYFGKGVHIETVRRQYDAILETELRGALSQAGHSGAWLGQISRIDNLLGDPLAGLSPTVDGFFAGVHDVASRPADPAARQNLLSTAQALVGRFHDLDAQLVQARSSVNGRVEASITRVNALAGQIARLNQDIFAAQASGGSVRPANDLLDQRDRLALELGTLAGTSVIAADNGDYNVFLGNGQSLVVGAQAYSMSMQQNPLDPGNPQIGLASGAGTILFGPGALSGGELGGLLAFRDRTLGAAQNALGRIAIALGEAFNAQHRLGVDRNGAPGGNLFAVGGPQVLTQSAAALSVTVSNVSQLGVSDYRLRYDGATYTLTRLDDSSVTTFAAFPQTIDGLTLTLAGPAPAAGDSFLILPTRNGASALNLLISDPARVAAAAPVRSAIDLANAGDAGIGPASVSAAYLATPLGAVVTLTYDAASGMLSGLPATPAFAYVPGAPITWNGITFSISGAPRDGDRFTLEPNVNGIGDNRNAIALAALQSAPLVGGATLQQQYATLVSDVGNRTASLQSAVDSQTRLVDIVRAARESVSGVNLDEEAANLLRYQQAYQAAGKMIAIASSLFETILGIGR